jgi:hypothetical protein
MGSGLVFEFASLRCTQSAVLTKPVPNFTRLDPGRPEIVILIDAMLRAREVVAARSWSTSQEPTSEYWWADVLADPRARIRQQHGYRRDGHRTAQKAFYRITDEPRPIIEAAFSRAELIANYGAEYPLPNLLDHLAAPGCSKIKSQWDPCGVYYRRARTVAGKGARA